MNNWKSQLLTMKEGMSVESEKIKFIDTHAHYYHSKFNKNRKELLTKLEDDLSHIINLGTDPKSNQETLVLLSLYDFIWGMIGFFPTSTHLLEPTMSSDADINLLVFEKQLTNNKIVGIGEIGLDYNWDCVGERGRELRGEPAREIQRKWFKYQIDLAIKLGLPVSMHSRDAEGDTLAIFDNYENINGVMHCFSYGLNSAQKYLEKGIYLGIGGTCTYSGNKELRDVIKYAPLDKLLLETDAPYLSPMPVRRDINNSLHIKYVIETIAQIKNITEDEVIKQTNENAFNLFKFKRR